MNCKSDSGEYKVGWLMWGISLLLIPIQQVFAAAALSSLHEPWLQNLATIAGNPIWLIVLLQIIATRFTLSKPPQRFLLFVGLLLFSWFASVVFIDSNHFREAGGWKVFILNSITCAAAYACLYRLAHITITSNSYRKLHKASVLLSLIAIPIFSSLLLNGLLQNLTFNTANQLAMALLNVVVTLPWIACLALVENFRPRCTTIS